MATEQDVGGISEFLTSEIEALGGFSPSPYYSQDTDALYYYARDTPCYSKRLNQTLTLILATDDDSLVGCKVEGVQWILKRVHDLGEKFGIVLHDETIRLGILIEFALIAPPENSDLEILVKQLELFADVEVSTIDLASAA